MITLRPFSSAVLVTCLLAVVSPARAALPDYQLGDTAREDVITPVALQVVNPEATEALKQKVAQQVPTIVRRTVPTTAEAEADLRSALTTARIAFLSSFKAALNGRAPVPADLTTPAYVTFRGDYLRTAPANLPLTRLAPLWVAGASDEGVIELMLQPLREIMGQPVVADKTENPLPANLPVRLIAVQTQLDSPTLQELETAGTTITAGKILSLSRARRVVETYFPTGQQELGRFAATFVRPNAYPAPGLTEILRAKRLDGVTVNDTYEPAQAIIRKGQIIDRKALSALAAVREKSLIGTLQTKLDQEQTVAGQLSQQTKWIAAGLGIMGASLILIFWRLRSRPDTSLAPVLVNPALANGDQAALGDGAGSGDEWRDRAMAAEVKAQRAQEAIRTGALGWMKEKVFQTVVHQRAELLSAQQRAEAEMRDLEQRLEQLHTPLQERIAAYEKRIEELEQDLAAKGEENRELIGARITVAKQQLNVERSRFGTN